MHMNLSRMNASEILAIYNTAALKLGRTQVKRFSDLKTAIRRTTEILKPIDELDGVPVTTPPSLAPVKPELKLTPPPSKRARVKGFNFPAREHIKRLNKGTLRERIATLLLQGATIGQVRDLIVAYDKERGLVPRDSLKLGVDAYEHVRNLHLYVGYGMVEDTDGVITLVGTVVKG